MFLWIHHAILNNEKHPGVPGWFCFCNMNYLALMYAGKLLLAVAGKYFGCKMLITKLLVVSSSVNIPYETTEVLDIWINIDKTVEFIPTVC